MLAGGSHKGCSYSGLSIGDGISEEIAMARRLLRVFTLAVTVVLWAWAGFAAEEPKKAPEAKPEFVVSEMRVQTFPGVTLLCGEAETTLAKIGAVAGQTISALHKAADDAHLGVTGPMIFVYQGATGQPDTPFKLSLGFPVAEGTKPVGDFKVKKLADLRCATVLFSGPLAKLHDAYSKLFPALMGAGHIPTGEMREYYLYWESPESPNNVLLLQAGIKEP